jgi:hypothetical protein
VLIPNVQPRVEKRCVGSGDGINTDELRTLVSVAEWAGKRKILHCGGTRMLGWDNVIDPETQL